MGKFFNKFILITIPVLILILNANPVLADTVVNGNFDTDLSGWTYTDMVCITWQAPGRVFVFCNSPSIWQDIDLTGDTLDFWYDNNGGADTFYVKIDGSLVYNVYSFGGNAQIDTSGYTGVHTVLFDGTGSFHLDNVHTDYTPPVPAVTDLTTESETNGIQLYTNVTTPYFDWAYNATQHNYMIYVGTTPGASDLWNSGNISSGNTFATYDGWTLNRGVTYYVQVKAYNTEWSAWENGTFKFNQLPVIADVSAIYDIDEGDLLSIDVNATDADIDSLIFSCNRTDLFTFNAATGVATWQTDYVDAGTYSVDFGVTDSFENDNQTTIVTITDVTVTETPTNDIPVVVSACNPIGEASSNDVPVSIQTTVLTGFEKVIDNAFNFFDKIFNLIF